MKPFQTCNHRHFAAVDLGGILECLDNNRVIDSDGNHRISSMRFELVKAVA